MTEDKRPDPKPKKHPELSLAYRLFDDLVAMRKRLDQREESSNRGKALASAEVSRALKAELFLDDNIENMRKFMIEQGASVGPIWDWLTSIKGLGAGNLAAQLLAHIDYPGPMPERPDSFDKVSKLWRFAGLAVIDGKAECGTRHYNRRLKALMLGETLIVDQFIRHHTPVYREVYDNEKERLVRLYPDPTCNECGAVAELNGKSWKCPQSCKVSKGFKVSHTPLHIDKMARRKVAKVFLQHLWVTWREMEGLPLTLPWILREGSGHNGYIKPAAP